MNHRVLCEDTDLTAQADLSSQGTYAICPGLSQFYD